MNKKSAFIAEVKLHQNTATKMEINVTNVVLVTVFFMEVIG
jgi:hypothetical protein